MTQASPTPALSTADPTGEKPTNFRWVICGLLFYATTVNYIDRSTLNTLEPTLRDIIHWRPYQYGLINAIFTLAYGIGFLVMGGIVDKVGTRIGYAIAFTGWSLAGIATAFTNTPLQFGLARFMLGLFEAGNFPAANKTTAEWFPQKQRATAFGLLNAGSNVGAFIAPILVLVILPYFGWRSVFFATPIMAIIWIAIWLKLYRPPALQPRANDAERKLIEADPVATPAPVKWRFILPHRQAWAFMCGKCLTDPVWWFYLFWSGAFFYDKFHVKLSGVALPLIYIYLLADVGSIGGGWLSSRFIRNGWTVNKARKVTMAICAAFVLPVIFAPLVPPGMPGGLWIAATLIGSAAAAHQGFSANIFITCSDMFPKRAVSSITGLGGLAGSLGSVVLQSVAGVTIELTHGDYLPLFIAAACAYPTAILLIHLFAPRLQRVGEDQLETRSMPRGVTALIFAVLGFAVAVPCTYLAQNNKDYRQLGWNIMVPAAFNDGIGKLPKDLIKSSEILKADSDHPVINIQLKRDPTPDEALKVEALKAFSSADVARKAALELTKPGFTFGEYIASVLPPGNIYVSYDRAALLPALIWIPLSGLLIGALLGAVLHGLIFSQRSRE